MDDPREDLLNNIKFDDVTIDSHPQIILLCGGPSPASSPPFYSARHYMSVNIQLNTTLTILNAEDKNQIKFFSGTTY